MDRQQYNNKIYDEILSDTSTFKPLESDPTLQKEDRLIRILNNMRDQQFISEDDYNLARPVGSHPARLYGLPKIHKENTPIRPILSSVKTFNYGLAKMLAKNLQHLATSQATIKDTFHFIDICKQFDSDDYENHKMISFDVSSLFTKVPLNKTIEIILDELYSLPSSHQCHTYRNSKKHFCSTRKNRDNLKTLLRIAAEQTHFTFNNKLYEQINGVSMGSPLASIMANIYMGHFEKHNKIKLYQADIKRWYRFVDDTFTMHGAPTNITSSHLPTSPLPPSTITSNNNNIFIQNTALKNKLLDIINDPEIIHLDTHDLGIKILPTTKSSETNPPPPIPKLYFNQKLKTIVAKHQNENHHTIDWAN
ncbi:unnamed protein product [Didymodactylos carnosus]|uniref:Reverse transcriptase domain-containing protein n=1 Tax=Didymodactylos carnosus TaxID=1234261 RepID=A0A8S2DT58_9BILA|nr:unnamed protein product [Didymodactylos carnosus]CAF3745617.1 unnamed protein product [Didymodactylos carnosus]